MKTKVNQTLTVAFIAFMLLSGSVNATGNETLIASALENITEAKLELENWMVNATYWANAEFSYELEEHLVVEGWMLQQEKWEVTLPQVSEEADNQLVLESWMTDKHIWN